MKRILRSLSSSISLRGWKLLSLLFAMAVVYVPGRAFAQSDPANTNPAELVAICSGGYMILNAVTSALRADNTAWSAAPPIVTRIIILIVGGGIQATLHTIMTGTPWYVALPAAMVTCYSAWITSGQRVAPGATAAEAAASNSGRPGPGSIAPPPAA